MSKQTRPEIKLMLHTAHLAKVEAYYSALGITWAGGQEPRYDESFRPKGPADVMGLPFLSGDFENMELIFYFREARISTDVPNTEICIRFSDVGDASHAIERLKATGLFQPAPGFDEFNRIVVDPDGRYVALCDPNPFSVV